MSDNNWPEPPFTAPDTPYAAERKARKVAEADLDAANALILTLTDALAVARARNQAMRDALANIADEADRRGYDSILSRIPRDLR